MMASLARAMPLAGFGGGIMIGLAAAVMLLADGRIAGVSGLTARVTGLSRSATPYGVAGAFVLGLPLGGWLVTALAGPVIVRFPSSTVVLLLGGLLVGYGTRLGSGCTSGHGVCGMSRLSPRSLAATGAFMLSGMATVAVMNAIGVAP
jgi:uncharacterized membrane protein YedE/YeeE